MGLQEAVKAAKKTFKSAGKPESRNILIERAKSALDAFFESAGLAFQSGKYHYKDASGRPGQRAMHETGFAQRAATGRLAFNASFLRNLAHSGYNKMERVSSHLNDSSH